MGSPIGLETIPQQGSGKRLQGSRTKPVFVETIQEGKRTTSVATVTQGHQASDGVIVGGRVVEST